MSRYIDADALVIDYYDDYETKDDIYTYAYVSDVQIDSAPSIEIVRCGECKFSEVIQNDSSGVMARYCRAFTVPMMKSADDFCSYGSRSEKPNNSKERSRE